MKLMQAIVLLLISLVTFLSFVFWKSQQRQAIYEKELKQLNEQIIELTVSEISEDLYQLTTEPLPYKTVNDSLIQCLKWLREEVQEESSFRLAHFNDYQHYIYNTLLPIGGLRTKGKVDSSLVKMTFDTLWTDNTLLNQSKKLNNVRAFLRYITRSVWSGREFFPYRFYFLQEEESIFYEKDTIDLPFLFFANYHYKIDKYSLLPTSSISAREEDYRYNLQLHTGAYKEGTLSKKMWLRIRNNMDNTIDTSYIVFTYQLKKRPL